MIIENTFTSIYDVAKTLFPSAVVSLMKPALTEKWESYKSI